MKDMSEVQIALDQFLRETRFRSVTDLIHIAAEEVVVVVRKMGFRSCIIDISGDHTPEEVINHLKQVTAIY